MQHCRRGMCWTYCVLNSHVFIVGPSFLSQCGRNDYKKTSSWQLGPCGALWQPVIRVDTCSYTESISNVTKRLSGLEDIWYRITCSLHVVPWRVDEFIDWSVNGSFIACRLRGAALLNSCSVVSVGCPGPLRFGSHMAYRCQSSDSGVTAEQSSGTG